MNPYLSKITPSSDLLFLSANFLSIISVKKSVIYCSCSSLGMRLRNGLTAFRKPDIKKKHKHIGISKRISYQIACLVTVPGHSYVAGAVTQRYSFHFACRISCGQISYRPFFITIILCVFILLHFANSFFSRRFS